MEVKKYYTAVEVAKVLGISKQTLLRYEKKKIFPQPRRNPLNNWREYAQEDLEKIFRIMGKKYKRIS